MLHVLDASDPAVEECYQTTVSVLSELGAGEIPVITVLNKIDKLENNGQIEGLLTLFPESITISVKTGYALDKLKNCIAEKINAAFV